MAINVEFYGIPRQRTAAACTRIDATNLGELLTTLAERFPRLATECLDAGRLQPGYVANINGERFVTDPATALTDGDSVLILSADAGG